MNQGKVVPVIRINQRTDSSEIKMNDKDDDGHTKETGSTTNRGCRHRLAVFTQETSFGGLQYIGGNGHCIRR